MSAKKEDSVVYLDYNATTFIHPKVAKEMEPYLTSYFGNPSSSHIFGIKTKQAVQKSRTQIATMLGANPSEIIFTSGGSESNNYAIKGLVYHYLHTKKQTHFQIITSSIEHPSVLEVFKYLEKIYQENISVVYLPVDSDGIVDMEVFKSKVTKDCILISVMHANNETGAVQPIKEISDYAKTVNPNIKIHSDASQSVGKIPVNVNDLGVDFLTIASHKFYGPKGIGALYIRQGAENDLEKIIHGANHEHNMRAGTENVLEIVGIGYAAQLVHEELKERMIHNKKTRNIIYKIIKENIPTAVLQGPQIDLDADITENNEKRLSNTLYISFPNVEANLILDLLSDKLACSAGAACHSDGVSMSYVLQAMGVSPSVAMGTLRISTGMNLTEEDAKKSAESIVKVVSELLAQKDKKGETGAQEDVNSCRLTKNTHGMGCGCKISPKLLNSILSSIPKMKSIENNKSIVVGSETNDDASVLRLPEVASNTLISTLDFLTPICDKAYDYGAIAAANALSDIYAMGGTPINALAIVAFPVQRLSTEVLRQILIGANEKCDEANTPLLGGHSIEDNEPKFGLSVNGLCEEKFIWKNASIEEGDTIIITKKIGVGTLMTGIKRDILTEKDSCIIEAIQSMKTLNKYSSEIVRGIERSEKERVVSACTDVTGFGLIGHLTECLGSSELSIELEFNKIPFMDRAKEMVEMDVVPGGAKSNYNYYMSKVEYDGKITQAEKYLLNDPQTSGGLVFFIKRGKEEKIEKAFEEKSVKYFKIGRVIKDGKKSCIKVAK